MPFTLAHPAAVLPLFREPFVPAALVAGSVAPDLPYFLRATGLPVTAQSWYEPFLNATTSHTLSGAATVGLPLAGALYLAWLVSRPAAAALTAAPAASPVTVGAPARRRTSRWAWVVVSLALGLATHLVWDSFTHGDGYVVTHVPALGTTVAGDLTWARLLQHLSTVAGLAVLAVHGWRRRSALTRLGVPARRRLATAAAASAGACTVGAALLSRRWWGSTPGTDGDAAVVEGVLSDAAKGAGAGLGALAAVAVVAWWVHRAASARH